MSRASGCPWRQDFPSVRIPGLSCLASGRSRQDVLLRRNQGPRSCDQASCKMTPLPLWPHCWWRTGCWNPVIVVTILLHSRSCLGQETAKGPFSLRVKLSPVYHARWRLHTFPLIAECQAGKLCLPIFIVFDLTQLGVKPESTASVADAVSTRPLIVQSTSLSFCCQLFNAATSWITIAMSIHKLILLNYIYQ